MKSFGEVRNAMRNEVLNADIALQNTVTGTIYKIPDTLPPLYFRYYTAGGGFQAHLVVGLQPDLSGWHLTIFETSWDGTVAINDFDGQPVTVGPYSFHITTSNDRAFWRLENGANSMTCVTDWGMHNKNTYAMASFMVSCLKKYMV